LLVSVITGLVGLKPCRVYQPSLVFVASMPAALENWRLLREMGCSLSRLLLEQPFSVLAPGSDFQPVYELEKLLQCHPLWPCWELALTRGAAYPLEDYPAAEMELDLEAQLARGNHQSALACLDKLEALNSVNVAHGYSFCLPVAALRNIEGTAVGPHGMAHQDTINEFGELAKKDVPPMTRPSRPGRRAGPSTSAA
jgi:hypothetical protein